MGGGMNSDYRKTSKDWEERLQMLADCVACDVNYAHLLSVDFTYYTNKAILVGNYERAEFLNRLTEHARATLAYYRRLGMYPED